MELFKFKQYSRINYESECARKSHAERNLAPSYENEVLQESPKNLRAREGLHLHYFAMSRIMGRLSRDKDLERKKAVSDFESTRRKFTCNAGKLILRRFIHCIVRAKFKKLSLFSGDALEKDKLYRALLLSPN